MRTTLHKTPIRDIIARATSADTAHNWAPLERGKSNPWDTDKILDLCDLIGDGMPIGAITITVPEPDYPYLARKSTQVPDVTGTIIDGVERITALCMLANQRPHWISESDWSTRKPRIVLDVLKLTFHDAAPEMGGYEFMKRGLFESHTLLNADPGSLTYREVRRSIASIVGPYCAAENKRLVIHVNRILNTRIPVLVATAQYRDRIERCKSIFQIPERGSAPRAPHHLTSSRRARNPLL